MTASSPASPVGERITAPNGVSALVRAEGRAAETVAFERDIVGFFVEAADLLGVPKSVAAIYGICFASPEALTFADIEARLDISKGSISQGLRVLREVGALKSIEVAGSRREFFAPELHLRKLTTHWLETRLTRQLDAGRTRLKGIAQAVPNARNGAGRLLRDRVKTLQGWHDNARSLLPIVRSFLKLT